MTMTEQQARSEAEKLMDYGRGFAYACIKQKKYAANEADEVRDLIAAALLSTYQRGREDGTHQSRAELMRKVVGVVYEKNGTRCCIDHQNEVPYVECDASCHAAWNAAHSTLIKLAKDEGIEL